MTTPQSSPADGLALNATPSRALAARPAAGGTPSGASTAVPPAPTAAVVAEGSTIRFGTRLNRKGPPELVARVTGCYTPGAILELRLYAEADGDGSDLKLVWEDRRHQVGPDGSYRMGLWKAAVGSLDRCTDGWTVRLVIRTPAGAVVQDLTEWVSLGQAEPR